MERRTIPTASSAKALIADDQPDVLEALRLLLKGAGYQTDSATSPAGVLKKLQDDRDCDVLLMDLNYARDTTSGQEGLDLLTHVRQIDASLPIVVMTAWGSIELAVEAMRRGVGDFVIKPWENERLLTTVRTQIAAGRSRRRVEKMEAERKSLKDKIDSATDVNNVCRTVMEAMVTVFGDQRLVVLARVSTGHSFNAFHSSESRSGAFASRVELESDFATIQGPVKISECEISHCDRKVLLDLDVEFVAPSLIDGKLLGILAFTPDAELTNEENRFIADVASMMASGLQNLQSRNQDRDYREALEIQRALLPESLPQVEGFEISAAWQPARIVGGDYYDAIELGEGRLAVCIADVSGKGMAAALLMSNLQAIIRSGDLKGYCPREVCNRVNRLLAANLAPGRFVSFFYCILDSINNRLEYCNAGHNLPILLRREGSIRRLDGGGTVLGAFPEWDYEDSSVEIGAGDRLVLFTDGVTEARDSSDEEYGEERLINLVRASRDLSASQTKAAIADSVADFAGAELHDDVTLVIVSLT